MKERPILFSAPMVLAILDWRKTQTRRVITPQPELIFRLTDMRVERVYNNHENKNWYQVEGYTCGTESRLHGGRGWSDIFEDEICGLWKKGLRGLVSISRAPKRKGLFNGVVVPPEQEDHKVRIETGLHGISWNANKGAPAGPSFGREEKQQQTGQFEVGEPTGAVDGRSYTWHFSRRREALGVQAIERRKAVFAVGHPEGPLFPAPRGENTTPYPSLRLLHHPWEVTRLWVKETWCCSMDSDEFVYRPEDGHHACLYRATTEHEVIKDDGDGGIEYRKDGTQASPWVSSLYMPRWASRITLEVTAVRVERLQEISFEDCEAEGGDLHMPNCGFYGTQKIGYRHVYNSDGVSIDGEPICDCGDYDGKETYAAIWDSINGKTHPWASNPWVWVIEFRRIKP